MAIQNQGWAYVSGSGTGGTTSPGGSDGNIQFNNNGSFSGSGSLVTDGSGSLSASVNISASAFYGDGSNLTGITASAVNVADGPEFSLQWRYDTPSSGDLSGSQAITWNTSSLDLTVTGNVRVQEDYEFYGDIEGAVRFPAQVDEAGGITRGQVVYINGISGQTPTVGLAACDDASKMPAFGLAGQTAADGVDLQVITLGSLKNLNLTALYDQTFAVGDVVYVQTGSGGNAGKLTNVRPTGSGNLLQNMGKVVRDGGGGDGQIKVGGAGRTNATPNLDKGYLFVGDETNCSSQDNTVFISSSANRVGINNTNPDHTLTVGGAISGSGNISGSAFYGQALAVSASTGGFQSGEIYFGTSAEKLGRIDISEDGGYAMTVAAIGTLDLSASEGITAILDNGTHLLVASEYTNTGLKLVDFAFNTAIDLSHDGAISGSSNLAAGGTFTVAGNSTFNGAATFNNSPSVHNQGLTVNNANAVINSGLVANGDVTLGDASGDGVTWNAGSWNMSANAVVTTLKDGVDGLSGNGALMFFTGSGGDFMKFHTSGSAKGIVFPQQTYLSKGGSLSGTLAGPGSFLAIDSDNKVVLATPSGGGSTSPGGSDTQVQFNQNGSFAGSSGLVYNGSGSLSIGTSTPKTTLDIHYTGSGNPVGLSNDTGGGEIVYFGTSSANLTAGGVYYLNSNGGWESVSSATTGSGHNQLLGIALGTKAGSSGMLLKGYFDVNSFYSGSFVKGGPVYIQSSSVTRPVVGGGYLSSSAPTAADSYVRVVGYGTDTPNVVYFNPDSTYIELS